MIQNPAHKGITDESLQKRLHSIETAEFWAFGSHTAPTTGTEHIHGFIRFRNSTTFERMKKLLPDGTHIEAARGNSAQNIDYIINSGPHKDKDTYIPGSLIQSSEKIPDDALRHMTAHDVIQDLEAGATPLSIVLKSPSLLKFNKFRDLQDIEAALLEDQYSNQLREVEVAYVQGPTRVGKTYNILHTYGISNVYRAVMSKRNPFDGYRGQDVMMFDEFRENVTLATMLTYLDKYPCTLEARYHDPTAAYTKVFIVSNWTFEMQYKHISTILSADYAAWVARFHYIRVYTDYCTYNEYTPADYFKLIQGEKVKPLRSVSPEPAPSASPTLPDVNYNAPSAPSSSASSAYRNSLQQGGAGIRWMKINISMVQK